MKIVVNIIITIFFCFSLDLLIASDIKKHDNWEKALMTKLHI